MTCRRTTLLRGWNAAACPSTGQTMLDLGCGWGYFGRACAERGMAVTYSDLKDLRIKSLKDKPFLQIDLNAPDFACGRGGGRPCRLLKRV